MGNVVVGIVTTVRDPGPEFTTWLSYHSAIVDYLLIFMDDPENKYYEELPNLPNVEFLRGNCYSTMSGGNGVMQRQCANVETAISRCREQGITWLLHIDSDELVWSRSADLKVYFRNVRPEISNVSFVNHEVVPTFSSDNFFKKLRLFKRNIYEDCDLYNLPDGRTSSFRFYSNGKSAIRVVNYAGTDGVHFFKANAGRRHHETDVCILHYACATYTEWERKYAQLGMFQSFWWDEERFPINFSFHLASRDAYHVARENDDWDSAKLFFKRALLPVDVIPDLLGRKLLIEVPPFFRDVPDLGCGIAL